MSAQSYQYRPLDPAADTIRLLNILPSSGDGTLGLLRLRHLRDLSKAYCQYDAVSYSWGLAGIRRRAIINGRDAYLQENIWRFLMHCRDTPLGLKVHPNLWIDAICINQDDSEEKNVQVQRMGPIYAKARSVLIWLGPVSENFLLSDTGLLESFYPRTEARRFAEEGSKAHPKYRQPRDASESEAVLDILRSPYWTRLWIVQELQLASLALIVSGTELVGISYIRPAVAAFETSISIEQWRAVQLTLTELKRRPSLSLLIHMCRHHQCLNVRDHIFGLLGLAKNGRDFPVNYDVSLGALLLQVLQFALRQDRDTGGTGDSLRLLDQLSTALATSAEDVLAELEKLPEAHEPKFQLLLNNLALLTEYTPICDEYGSRSTAEHTRIVCEVVSQATQAPRSPDTLHRQCAHELRQASACFHTVGECLIVPCKI